MPKRAIANDFAANETYANAPICTTPLVVLTAIAFSVMLYPVAFCVWLYEVAAKVKLHPTSFRVRLPE